MNILITGATTFVGSHYVRHLNHIRPDAQVTVSCASLELGTELAELDNVEFLCGDLLDETYARQLMTDIELVVHCSAPANSKSSYSACYQNRVVSAERALSAAREAGVRRFINVGSSSVYLDFNDHLNVTEEFLPIRFADNDARTQYQAESRVRRAHSDQLKTIGLRPHWVIGSEDSALLQALLTAHTAGQLHQVGEGRNIVSMTSIENLMHAIDCAVFGGDEVTGDIYNIADPRPVNLWQTLNDLFQQTGKTSLNRKISYPTALVLYGFRNWWHQLYSGKPNHPLTRRNINLLVRSFTLNIEKARRKLGYHPKQNIEYSLRQLARCASNNSTADCALTTGN